VLERSLILLLGEAFSLDFRGWKADPTGLKKMRLYLEVIWGCL
jgi:hypothetical protein